MDVAKYIGFFLLKNEQCYVNGLGTLQLQRKAATYDGQYLQAATQEIIIVPGGNVDESLANYIATNEQISITKASAALKEYSEETKGLLQAGNEVALPHLGKFMAQDGRIGFITSPHLQYKAAPIAAKKGVSMQHNERPPIPHQSYIPQGTPVGTQMPAGAPPMPQVRSYMAHQPEPKERLNWARIIFVLLLLVIMAGGTYYGYMRYMAPKKRDAQPPLTFPESVDETSGDMEPMNEEMPVMADSSSTISDSVMPPAQEAPAQKTAMQPAVQEKPAVKEPQSKPVVNNTIPATGNNAMMPASKPDGKKVNMKVVVNTFDSKDEAYKRKRSLEARGNKAEVIEEDIDYYFVVMPVTASPSDTGRILDSLSSTFNPNGVFVY
ncbi:MAG: hypothetical protein KDC07_08645 [Chitinophagaceae bacterium]|nr:hypothetical protein [Chitinophagaceae bacterium]MCB9047041.1 hypothetical protein [Chitinophagales bacterium]